MQWPVLQIVAKHIEAKQDKETNEQETTAANKQNIKSTCIQHCSSIALLA